ncbi:hypothetical protein IEN85_16375 [Pelagicoccus sp. NFK12]|uniref:Glycosyl transferase n=1 Tax=Pelagicoccus enzymogenes TaxID=2773457 RepID=A0A927FB26_9BACT|nr:hypothetical protein [Pelagicoccus enzymogenes]MBD5781076.1 hypothetical protein [Pelagicoccus enzymogenes]
MPQEKAKKQSKLRKIAGRAKFYIFDHWPYYPMEMLSKKRRVNLRKDIPTLRQIDCAEDSECEIHVLCSLSHLDMGIWSTWSFKKFYPNYKLYIHSDGSLQEKHIKEWKRILPGSELISESDSDQQFNSLLSAKYPHISNFRKINPYSKKLIDFHLFGRAKKILMFDSDVLCFREPTEITKAIKCKERFIAWNKDTRNAYPCTIDEFAKYTNIRVLELFNSGLVVTKRFDNKHFEFIETILEKLNTKNINKTNNLEQALYAFCATRFENAEPLPDNYTVYLGKTKKTTPVRHYVGVKRIRPRFFLEGLKRTLSEHQE